MGVETPKYDTPEIKQKFEADGYDWEKVKEQLEKIAKREEVDKKLDELSGKTDDYYVYLKKLIDTEQKNPSPTLSETIQDVAQDAAEVATDTAKQVVEDTPDAVADWAAKKAGEKVTGFFDGLPFGLGEKLGDVSKKIGDLLKTLFTALAGAFGGLGITKWFKNTFGWDKDFAKPEAPEIPKPNTQRSNESLVEGGKGDGITEKISISPESKRELYYIGGANILLSFSLVEIDNSESDIKKEILKGYSKLTYGDILSGKTPDIPQDKIGNNKYEKMISGIQEGILSENSQKLVKISLKPESISQILKPNGQYNTELYSYFAQENISGEQRVKEICESIENGTFSLNILSFHEICTLYSLTLPGIGGIIKEGLGILGDSFIAGFGISKEFINSLPEGKINPEIIKIIMEEKGSIYSGGRNTLNDDDAFKKIFEGKENITMSQINDIISFKNWVLSDLPNIPQLFLGDEDIKTAFESNLNYGWIIALYEEFNGQKQLPTNPINLPLIILTIQRIIGQETGNALENANLAGGYIGSIGNHILGLTTETNILTEDQKTVLGILAQKGMYETYITYMKGLNSTIGAGENFLGIDAYTFAGAAIGGGLAMNIVANSMTSKALEAKKFPLIGRILKKFAWISMLTGALVGGVKFLGDNKPTSKFSQDLQQSFETGDINKFREILLERQRSLKTYDFHGKALTVSTYPGETPYAQYNGELYVFSIVDKSGELDKTNLETTVKTAIPYLLSNMKDMIVDPDGTITQNGKEVSLFPVTSNEQGNIILGNSGFTLSNDVWNKINNSSMNSQENLIQLINNGVEGVVNGEGKLGLKTPEWFSKLGKTTQYIPIQEVSSNIYISLVSVGRVEDIIPKEENPS